MTHQEIMDEILSIQQQLVLLYMKIDEDTEESRKFLKIVKFANPDEERRYKRKYKRHRKGLYNDTK